MDDMENTEIFYAFFASAFPKKVVCDQILNAINFKKVTGAEARIGREQVKEYLSKLNVFR